MKVDGVPYHSIWINDDGWSVDVIDQTRLPFEFEIKNLKYIDQACAAIRDMVVRGAPLIGATAAYGYYLAMRKNASDHGMQHAYDKLLATRPTAVNLRWALDKMRVDLATVNPVNRADYAFELAGQICVQDIETNRAIARHGLPLLEEIAKRKGGEPVNILTHCNAGWLATVDWGTATAPIYLAHDAGIPLHVWVDETRPRNQGALTAWELGHHAVPHTYIVDNAGGHLMQQGQVDLCLVGSDRTTRGGDVCNKIGTYLKALAAFDNGVPFYACVPGSTIDWTIDKGLTEVPIEQRNLDEVSRIQVKSHSGKIDRFKVTPDDTGTSNPAFDITPANLITGLITEIGVLQPTESELRKKFACHELPSNPRS